MKKLIRPVAAFILAFTLALACSRLAVDHELKASGSDDGVTAAELSRISENECGTVEVQIPDRSGDAQYTEDTDVVHYGDTVRLKAVHTDEECAFRWQVNDGTGWKDIDGEDKDIIEIEITEVNATYEYRALSD